MAMAFIAAAPMERERSTSDLLSIFKVELRLLVFGDFSGSYLRGQIYFC